MVEYFPHAPFHRCRQSDLGGSSSKAAKLYAACPGQADSSPAVVSHVLARQLGLPGGHSVYVRENLTHASNRPVDLVFRSQLNNSPAAGAGEENTYKAHARRCVNRSFLHSPCTAVRTGTADTIKYLGCASHRVTKLEWMDIIRQYNTRAALYTIFDEA